MSASSGRDIGLSAVMAGLETMGLILDPNDVFKVEISAGKLVITTIVKNRSGYSIPTDSGLLMDSVEYRIIRDIRN